MSNPSTLPWQAWQPDDLSLTPETDNDIPDTRPAPHPAEPTEQPLLELEQLHSRLKQEAEGRGHAEGYQKGFNEGQQQGYNVGLQQGREDAEREMAPLQSRLQQWIDEFSDALKALDNTIAARVLQVALETAHQVIGEAPRVDGSALLKQIQQLIQQEPLFSGNLTLRVHPDDLPTIEEHLGTTLTAHGWTLFADDTLFPGGCKLTADEGELDSNLSTRWQEVCRLAAPPGASR